MQRYQVYYEPSTMDILSELSQLAGVSRSRLLQDLAEVVAARYVALVQKKKSKKSSLLELSGTIKTKDRKVTYSSTKPDSDYFGV